jgi:hypothetical protein
MGINTLEIGNGLLPNRYWVSVSNNYYYVKHKTGHFNRIGDLKLCPERFKTVEHFPSYEEAEKWVGSHLRMGKRYAGVKVNYVEIEDTLSGETFLLANELVPEEYVVYPDDLFFTSNITSKTVLCFN